MALAADHEMVVDRDTERSGGLGDFLGHLDVIARGFGVSTGMVVQQRSVRHTTLISKEVRGHRQVGGIWNWGR